jgi:deferrochelatase/peroxidase EfeB
VSRPALSRREVLRGGVLLGGAAVAGAGIAGCGDDAKADEAKATNVPGSALSAPTGGLIPFHGPHQAGITTPPPAAAILTAFDTVAPDRATLAGALQSLTVEARRLSAGVVDPARDPLEPPDDNLILGPVPAPDSLTVTVSVGASLFDSRYGLADRRPRQLVEMPAFPNDTLQPERVHGDVLVQVNGGTNETCIHALRRLMRATRDSMVVRWMVPGFNQPNTLEPGRVSTRNLLGFKDGTANLAGGDDDLMAGLVWVQAGDDEPGWTAAGSYHVVRIIRMRVEFWDRTPLRTQETIIGRKKATGAPLDGTTETDVPDFGADPDGHTFRLDGHIRLANPRSPDTEKNRILRRGFSYSLGFDAAGHFDQGLLFQSFQRDLEAGFVAVQNRLNGEALEEYITPVGGGYFFALPGVQDDQDWYGRALLN